MRVTGQGRREEIVPENRLFTVRKYTPMGAVIMAKVKPRSLAMTDLLTWKETPYESADCYTFFLE